MGGRGRSQHLTGAQREKEDKSKLVCTHCGKHKHTKKEYFEFVGYPDWWKGRQTGTRDTERGACKGARAVGIRETDASIEVRGRNSSHGRPFTEGTSGGLQEEEGPNDQIGYSYEGDYWTWH